MKYIKTSDGSLFGIVGEVKEENGLITVFRPMNILTEPAGTTDNQTRTVLAMMPTIPGPISSAESITLLRTHILYMVDIEESVSELVKEYAERVYSFSNVEVTKMPELSDPSNDKQLTELLNKIRDNSKKKPN